MIVNNNLPGDEKQKLVEHSRKYYEMCTSFMQ